ncbi:MAG: BREX-3 system P-loop-containing protein BrxF [Caldilinea sp.]|nr:BREX-3 system P-loop-containing protein BrxF [Caldilineaceae bacterium]MCW5844894.1 BREX-3 system P-loop-containing protein BrxF [Caldilinea sp.]
MSAPATALAVARRTDEVLALLEPAEALYSRLILVVGRGRSGKSTVLRKVAEQTGAEVCNMGLLLSEGLLACEPRQYPLRCGELLDDYVRGLAAGPALLDNIDLLFDKMLAVDPMSLLQKVARSQTVVAAWRGHVDRGMLHYAIPGHREWRSTPVNGVLLVDLNPGEIP